MSCEPFRQVSQQHMLSY